MRFRDSGPSFCPELFESPIPEIPEQNARRFVRVVRQFALDLRIDATRDDENIWIAIVVEVDHSRSPAYESSLDADLGGPGSIIKITLAVIAVDATGVAHEVGLEQIKMTGKLVVSDTNAHSRLFHAVVAQCHPTHHAFLTKGSVVVVHEKQTGCRVARNQDVGPSVLVKVRCHHGHPVAFCCARDSGFLADIRERAVAIVPVQKLAPRWQASGTTVNGNSFPVAGRSLTGHWSFFQIEPNVVRYKKIEVPIPVVVDEAAPGSPASLMSK